MLTKRFQFEFYAHHLGKVTNYGRVVCNVQNLLWEDNKSGLKKVQSLSLGQVIFLAGQVTNKAPFPNGQEYRQVKIIN